MSRWLVRAPVTPDGLSQPPGATVEADWLDLDHGVLSFYRDEEQTHNAEAGSVYDGKLAKWVKRYETVTETVSILVRAFGVGQWRDVEPLVQIGQEPRGIQRGIPRGDGPAFA